jgi:hypothetical protein
MVCLASNLPVDLTLVKSACDFSAALTEEETLLLFDIGGTLGEIGRVGIIPTKFQRRIHRSGEKTRCKATQMGEKSKVRAAFRQSEERDAAKTG